MTSQRCANCVNGYTPSAYDPYAPGYRCPWCVDGWVTDPAFYEPDPLYPIPGVPNE